MDEKISVEKAIRELVKSNVITFAQTFSGRHISEYKDPEGAINMKIHNVFIAALGKEIQYYTSLVRSFDSSLGNMLENLAIRISSLFYKVSQKVVGPLYPEQTTKIAQLLESYKNPNNPKKVSVDDYKLLRLTKPNNSTIEKTHFSDYYLLDEATNRHYLIELKIGGDLDNKKARSEKEALFEQYAILSNTLGSDAEIFCYFATAYNRYGEDEEWNQSRVRQFFSEKELLIGRDFWNFVCKSENGYEIVIDEYKNNSGYIIDALEKIKLKYLN